MKVIVNEDFSATVTSDDGLLECHFPAYNVETLEPITTKEAAEAQAMVVLGRESLYLAPKPVITGNLAPTPPEFLLLLTLQERVAIRKARATNDVVEDLMQLIDDPRLTFVELTSPSVIEAINYLASGDAPLITPARAKRVLAGLSPVVAA